MSLVTEEEKDVLTFESVSCLEEQGYDKGNDEIKNSFWFEFENNMDHLSILLKLCVYENQISELFGIKSNPSELSTIRPFGLLKTDNEIMPFWSSIITDEELICLLR